MTAAAHVCLPTTLSVRDQEIVRVATRETLDAAVDVIQQRLANATAALFAAERVGNPVAVWEAGFVAGLRVAEDALVRLTI